MIDNKTFTLVGAFKDDITPSLRKITKGIADLTKGFDKLQSKLRPMSKDMGVLAMSLDRVATSFQAQRVSLESNVRAMAEYRREAGKVVAANKAVANSANKIRPLAQPKGGRSGTAAGGGGRGGYSGGRPYSPSMPPPGAPLRSTTQKGRDTGAHEGALARRRDSGDEARSTKGYAGGSVVADIVSGGIITSAIVSGFQMGANIIEGAFQKFANAFTERVGDQIEDIASAGGIFTGAKSAGLTAFGNSIDDAMAVQKDLNRSMATLAADLPGTTNDFVQNARSITDTVMTAMSKQPQQFVKSVGDMTGLKNLDEKSAFIEAIKGLAESTTMLEKLAPGGGTTMTMLFEDMMSQDQINAKSMQRRYSQMRRNPTLVAALERNQKEINKYAAGTTERMLAISKALKQAVPPEMVNTMKRSVSGVVESFKSNFTDPDTGLFGLSRQLSFTVRQFDSVTGRVREGAQEAVGIFDILADIIGGFGVVFNSSIIPAILDAFMPFNEMGLSLVNLREYSWKLFETIQSSTAFFKNIAEKNNMDPAKFQAGLRGGLDTMAAILSTFGGIGKGQLASIETRLQSKDADLKGIGQEILSAFMNSDFVNWLTEFAGMIVGKFLSAIADVMDKLVYGVDKIAQIGFGKGFQKAGGSKALERIVADIFHLIVKAILKGMEVLAGAFAESIKKGDWGAAAGLAGMIGLITMPFHGMVFGLFSAVGKAINMAKGLVLGEAAHSVLEAAKVAEDGVATAPLQRPRPLPKGAINPATGMPYISGTTTPDVPVPFTAKPVGKFAAAMEEFLPTFTAAFKNIGPTFKSFVYGLESAGPLLVNFTRGVGPGIIGLVNGLKSIGPNFFNLFRGGFSKIGGFFELLGQGARGLGKFGGALTIAVAAFDFIANLMSGKDLAHSLGAAAGPAFGTVLGFALGGPIGAAVGSWIGGLKPVTDFFTGAFQAIGESFAFFGPILISTAESLGSIFVSLFNIISPLIPGLGKLDEASSALQVGFFTFKALLFPFVALFSALAQGVLGLKLTMLLVDQWVNNKFQGGNRAGTLEKQIQDTAVESDKITKRFLQFTFSSAPTPAPAPAKAGPPSANNPAAAMAFGSANPFMGNLGSAIQFEQQNKPSGSHLIVANSSETVIPAARGYGAGVGDLIESIETQTFSLSRTIDSNNGSLVSSVVLGFKSQVGATMESTNRIVKEVDKSIRVETEILKIVEIFRMENYNNLQSIIASNTRPPGGGGAGGGVSAEDEQVGQWADIINRVAAEEGVPAELIAKVMKQESGGRNNQTSSSGAKGLMQLKEGTASGLGVTDIWDPEQNIRGGAKYLKQMLELSGGDEKKALAKYNQGPNATPAALAGTGATYANEVLGQRVTMSPSGQVAGAGTFLGRPISPGLTDALNMARGMGFADPTPNQFVGGGHAPGGLHPQGRAMDFSADTIKMSQLAATLAGTNPAQLIWSGPGPQSMANGKQVDPIEYWGQATWSNHRDHVHVGYGFGPGSPAFFSTQDQALKWERSMAPRNAAIASVTSNSSEFRGGGSHTFNNNINITTRPDQNPQDIADTVLYELERRVATVRSSSLFFS